MEHAVLVAAIRRSADPELDAEPEQPPQKGSVTDGTEHLFDRVTPLTAAASACKALTRSNSNLERHVQRQRSTPTPAR